MKPREWLACLVLSVASACTSISNMDAGRDGSASGSDVSPSPCPLTEPNGSCPLVDGQSGPWCVYGARQCRCTNVGGAGAWMCESSACPTSPIENGTPCDTLGLACDPGPESDCVCLNREHTWFCCNHGANCPGNYVEGGLCCTTTEFCSYVDGGVQVAPSCIDHHWHIETAPVDAGGE